MAAVDITTTGNTITVTSPYHPDFSPAARNLGGRWNPATKTWSFDTRDETAVRELCTDLFGTDGSTPAATVTVRLCLDRWMRLRTDSIYFAGRRVAHRASRDSRVQLGDGVILVQGGFPASGGSVKNVDLCPQESTVLEIRDVPAGHSDLKDDDATIVDTTLDRDALRAERERLVARLAEIDALLGGVQ